MKWKKYVKSDKKFFRHLDVDYLKRDIKKAQKEIGWKPKVTFEKLVKIMVKEDLKRWKMFLDGKSFPWDAPLYPEESGIITKNSKEKRESIVKIIKKPRTKQSVLHYEH